MLWGLPRFLNAKNGTQNPRSRLHGMPEPNATDRPSVSVEVETGRVVAYRDTEQISVRFFPAQENDIYTSHPASES